MSALFGLTKELMDGVSCYMFKPFATTGIGSLPFLSPDEACRLVLDTFDIPFWPQLPKLSFFESMIPQFSEGMPFLKIDSQRRRLWVEKDHGPSLTEFYETYSQDWKSTISEDYAKGLYTFTRLLEDTKLNTLKGQITGPLTFTLGLKDSKGKPVYFDEELREISLMLLKAKVRWQTEILRPLTENIILFIDEPILSALGSTTYLGVEPRETLRLLKETVDCIRNAGGIPGIHCCGNADWPVVIESGAEIISFDAYGYIDTIAIYPEEFREFLKEGGYLAWGIVPTTEMIKKENADSIKRRFYDGLTILSKSIPTALLLSRILLTPSCGTGSMSVDETLKVFKLLKDLKEAVS